VRPPGSQRQQHDAPRALLADTPERIDQIEGYEHDRHLLPVVDRVTGFTLCEGSPARARILAGPLLALDDAPWTGPRSVGVDLDASLIAYGDLVRAATRWRALAECGD
jgi:hypothetical protein